MRTLGVQGFVHVKVNVLDLRVLLPCVGCRSAHDNLDAVVLDGSREILWQSALTDEFAHGLLHLRTQSVHAFLTLVLAQYSRIHLVDDRKICCLHSCDVCDRPNLVDALKKMQRCPPVRVYRELVPAIRRLTVQRYGKKKSPTKVSLRFRYLTLLLRLRALINTHCVSTCASMIRG